MPDWVTHIAVAYILCTIIGFKYRQFNTSNTVLAMVGAVLPDVVKLGLVGEFLGYEVWDQIWAVHLPLGTLIIAGMVSLFFQDKRTAFLFFVLGAATHYTLDLLLFNVSGGIALLYPFYWEEWQLDLFTTENFHVPIVVLAVAVLTYLVSRRMAKKGSKEAAAD